MSWLRRIIEPNPRAPVYLHTRRKVGYTFYPNGVVEGAEVFVKQRTPEE
jgi:hypothetical protein